MKPVAPVSKMVESVVANRSPCVFTVSTFVPDLMRLMKKVYREMANMQDFGRRKDLVGFQGINLEGNME